MQDQRKAPAVRPEEYLGRMRLQPVDGEGYRFGKATGEGCWDPAGVTTQRDHLFQCISTVKLDANPPHGGRGLGSPVCWRRRFDYSAPHCSYG